MGFIKSNQNSSETKYEVKENYGVLGYRGKNKPLELRLISWFGKEEKYDIREWDKTDDDKEIAGKGITLTGEEAKNLLELLNKIADE